MFVSSPHTCVWQDWLFSTGETVRVHSLMVACLARLVLRVLRCDKLFFRSTGKKLHEVTLPEDCLEGEPSSWELLHDYPRVFMPELSALVSNVVLCCTRCLKSILQVILLPRYGDVSVLLTVRGVGDVDGE
jgi:hypothetical protein